jgi:hypothetical protein
LNGCVAERDAERAAEPCWNAATLGYVNVPGSSLKL